MKKVRIGVIGCGAIAQGCHIPGYAAAKNCVLAAAADPRAAAFDELAEKGFSFENTYSDYREMLKKEKLDAISICTPNALHKEMAVACLKHGADILLEKPMALSMREASAIKNAQKFSRKRVMVSFSHRFNNWNRVAREHVKKGDIGKLYMVRIRFAHMGPIPGWAKTDWFYKLADAGGGAMMDMAIHAFDLAQWYAGPVTAVQAKVSTLRKKIEVDDNSLSILEFGKGCMGYVEAGWTSCAGFSGVELMGDKGSICVNYGEGKVTMIQGGISPDGSNKQVTTVLTEGLKKGHWQTQMAEYTELLSTRRKFPVGLEEGISSLKVALAAYESNDTGQRVKIS